MKELLFKHLKFRIAEIDESMMPLLQAAIDEYTMKESISFANWLSNHNNETGKTIEQLYEYYLGEIGQLELD